MVILIAEHHQDDLLTPTSFYHMNISAEGKALYTGGEQGFFQSVVLGYTQMFVRNQEIGKILAVIAAISVIFCLILTSRRLRDNDYSLMLIVFVVTNLAMQLFMRKGYITGRVLLPFYAFLMFCLRELYAEAGKRMKYIWRDRRIRNGIAVVICAVMMIQCIGKTDIFRTQDWEDNYQLRDYVEAVFRSGGGYKPENQGYWVGEFYRQKYEKVITDHLDSIEEKKSLIN